MWILEVILRPHNNIYSWKLLVRFKRNNDTCTCGNKLWGEKQTMTLTCESYLWGRNQTMTRSCEMHCACDDLPSPLSYLSNHFCRWKQKWLLATGQNLSVGKMLHYLWKSFTCAKWKIKANQFLLEWHENKTKKRETYISFKHLQHDAKKCMLFICVSSGVLFKYLARK